MRTRQFTVKGLMVASIVMSMTLLGSGFNIAMAEGPLGCKCAAVCGEYGSCTCEIYDGPGECYCTCDPEPYCQCNGL